MLGSPYHVIPLHLSVKSQGYNEARPGQHWGQAGRRLHAVRVRICTNRRVCALHLRVNSRTALKQTSPRPQTAGRGADGPSHTHARIHPRSPRGLSLLRAKLCWCVGTIHTWKGQGPHRGSVDGQGEGLWTAMMSGRRGGGGGGFTPSG